MGTMSAPPSLPAPVRSVIQAKPSLRNAVFPTYAVFSSIYENIGVPSVIDWALGNKQSLVPSGNVVFSSWNAPVGKAASFTLLIDFTSGVYAITLPPNFIWLGADPLMSDTRVYALSVIWDGANFYGSAT